MKWSIEEKGEISYFYILSTKNNSHYLPIKIKSYYKLQS